MQIYVCDICGEELPNGPDTLEEMQPFLEGNPNGIFNLDYRPVIVSERGKPVGFDYKCFHMCRCCCTMISHAILNEIGKIQESVHKPSVVIPIRKFDTSPTKEHGRTPTCGEAPFRD